MHPRPSAPPAAPASSLPPSSPRPQLSPSFSSPPPPCQPPPPQPPRPSPLFNPGPRHRVRLVPATRRPRPQLPVQHRHLDQHHQRRAADPRERPLQLPNRTLASARHPIGLRLRPNLDLPRELAPLQPSTHPRRHRNQPHLRPRHPQTRRLLRRPNPPARKRHPRHLPIRREPQPVHRVDLPTPLPNPLLPVTPPPAHVTAPVWPPCPPAEAGRSQSSRLGRSGGRRSGG